MSSCWLECVELVRARFGSEDFDLAVILGSGFSALTEALHEESALPYGELPGMPGTSVLGHEGRLVAGLFEGARILLFEGRFHLYEGFTAREAAAPVCFARALGIERLLITNAAGGVNEDFRAGDFMLLDDHINLSGDNPLRGEKNNPFIDLCGLYRTDFYSALREAASQKEIALHKGVLASVLGPSYETPAEIRMLRALGADVASMSTVHEAIMGRYLGMEVVGLSLISNPAAGLGAGELRHEDVLATGQRAAGSFLTLARALVALWSPETCR